MVDAKDDFRIVQTEGLRQVTRNTKHYNLQMIIAVGFKVNNERADADKPHMGLTAWAAAPEGKIVKSDVSVAKVKSEFVDYRSKVNENISKVFTAWH